jgi:hypothetical protein
MDNDKKSVKPTKKGDSNREGSDARLHLIPPSLTESSKKIKRPRPMTVDEARCIANGKKMKVTT